jgi:hypothetical protein
MSKKWIYAGLGALILGISPGAVMADEARGTIVSVDAAAGTVTLENGQTFAVPKATTTEPAGVGDWVKIEYQVDPQTGLMVAVDVDIQM